MKRRLALVEQAEQPLDIGALIREDIRARDWERVHVESHRSKPIDLDVRKWRLWR